MKLAKKFMVNNKPIQKSKLSEINDDISLLVDNKFPIKQIHEFITSEAKISVDLSYLYRYIKKLKAEDTQEAPVKTTKKKEHKIVAIPVAAPAIVEKESKTISSSSAQEPQKEMTFLEKTAARLKVQEEAGVKPTPVGYWKPKTLMIDILGKQDE